MFAAALAAIACAAPAQQLAPKPVLVPPATVPSTLVIDSEQARALTGQDVDAWLDGFMPYALHTGDIAGAVVFVVKDGQVIAGKGYGYADVAKRVPVDPARTLFRAGSVSKLITWTAVMQQVQAGRIDLDADVNRYLDFRIPPRNGQPITMRQIMTHTAGFEEAVKGLITHDRDNLMSLEAYLKRWTPRRIFDAGTTPAYSNWATTLSSYVVQRVSGLPFDDYVDQRVFAPIGMTSATMRQPLPARLIAHMAQGYPRASMPAQPFEFVQQAPAGSLSASGLDMAKFMIAHLQQGRGLLSPAVASTMHQSPTAKVNPKSLISPLNRMELGFFETNLNGHEVIGHLGDVEYFHTSLHLFLNDGVGLYVSFNSAGKEAAAQTVRAQLFEDFADRYFPDAREITRVDARTAANHAKMMVGLWAATRRSDTNFGSILTLFGQTKVGLDEHGGLSIPSLVGPGGGVRKWDEVAPFVWRDRYGHDRLAAKVVDGRVVRWSFDMVSPFTMFDPVPAAISSAWLVPALIVSLLVLLLTALHWPATWLIRRRYAAPLKVEGEARRAYRAVRTMAWAELIAVAGWAALLVTLFSNLTLLNVHMDPVLWIMKLVGCIVFNGAVAIAGWSAWVAWRNPRRWTARMWSALVFLATIIVLYVAVAFNVIALSVNY